MPSLVMEDKEVSTLANPLVTTVLLVPELLPLVPKEAAQIRFALLWERGQVDRPTPIVAPLTLLLAPLISATLSLVTLHMSIQVVETHKTSMKDARPPTTPLSAKMETLVKYKVFAQCHKDVFTTIFLFPPTLHQPATAKVAAQAVVTL